MWKDFLYFSKQERIGIYVLIALIVIIISTDLLITHKRSNETQHLSEENKKEYSDFITSVRENGKVWESDYRSYPQSETTVILSPFDPNLADSITFIHLGLRSYIVRNILRYRAKGGKFRTPNAFAKIYGITPQQFKTLLPYITISQEFCIKHDTVINFSSKDSMKIFKYPEGVILDINHADTTELKKIPGIGSSRARMITAYRDRLGGFYKAEQLQEIKSVPAELNKWFSIKNSLIRRININKASIERLNAHPYINFYQAKIIIEYRKKKGNLKSIDQLALYEEFTKEDLERISHYVVF